MRHVIEYVVLVSSPDFVPEKEMSKYLNCLEVSLLLRVPLRTVQRWAKYGTGPVKAVQFGGKNGTYRFPGREIIDLTDDEYM
jgi:hypothetical protein